MFKIFLWTLLLVSLITPNLSFGNISLVAAKRRIVKKSIKKPKIIQQSVSLNVIFSKQDYSLSCEVASLQMALAYKGIVVSEDELLSQIPKTGPFVKEFQPDGTFVWGDPDIGFVGDANGKWKGANGLVDGTGWGVNYGPIANLTQSYRESSYGKRGGNSQDLRSELNAGNPVIIWEQSDKTIKEEVYYKTETGKDIKFIQDHVVLITGYRVSKKHGFVYTIKDPFYGETIWSEARLNRYWSRYNNDMVVVK
jgi:uncharacterized protein YvpB